VMVGDATDLDLAPAAALGWRTAAVGPDSDRFTSLRCLLDYPGSPARRLR